MQHDNLMEAEARDAYWKKCHSEGRKYHERKKEFVIIPDYEPLGRIDKLEEKMGARPYHRVKEELLKMEHCREQDAPHPILLDVGCGDGAVAAYYAQAGFDVVAFDYSEGACQDSEATAKALTVKFTGCGKMFVQPPIDIMDFDLSNVSLGGSERSLKSGFDCLILHEFLHQCRPSGLGRLRQRVLSLLRPDGLLFVCVKSRKHPLYGLPTHPQHSLPRKIEDHVFEFRDHRPVHYLDGRALDELFLNPPAGADVASRIEMLWSEELEQDERTQRKPMQIAYRPWVIYYLGRKILGK